MLKNSEKYVIGIDFGSLSARAMIVRVSDGVVVGKHSEPYPHGVLNKTLPNGTPLPKDFALACPDDYLDVMTRVVRISRKVAGIMVEDIISVGIDATSCTLVPTDSNGICLAQKEEFKDRPHAYIKMWMHHAAIKYASRFETVAKANNQDFLNYCGSRPSCEWTVAKMLEVREQDPYTYRQADYFVDLCEWLTWVLTGKLVRSVSSAGFKCHWRDDVGYPSAGFFNLVADGFGDEFYKKVSGTVGQLGEPVGLILPEMAKLLNLTPNTIVAVGSLDGQSPISAIGINRPGEAALVVGTSNVVCFLSEKLIEIPGICGIVNGGFKPGFYAYETAQACTGDMLRWFIEEQVPIKYHNEAEQSKIPMHQFLSERVEIRDPSRNPLTVLDWWNGNRCVLQKMNISGAIIGYTMLTTPEDIYCAMLQGIACNTRIMIEHCESYGINLDTITACGGIPSKNPFYMQQYANVLNRELRVLTLPDAPAIGAAIQAAVAAGSENGGYDTFTEAEGHMSVKEYITYRPRQEDRDGYEDIFERYKHFYYLLGNNYRADNVK